MPAKILAILGVLVTAQAARADVPAPIEPRKERSLAVALLLPLAVSTTGVMLSVALEGEGPGYKTLGAVGVAGALVGPSLGRIYVDDLSITGPVLVTTGIGIIGWTFLSGDETPGAVVPVAIGAGFYLVGALYQIISARVIAHRQNKALTLMPAPIVTPQGTAVGLVLGGAF